MSESAKTVQLVPVEVLLTFLERYQSMREAQRDYFPGNGAKELERRLDAQARELLLTYAEQDCLQKSLFG